MHTHISALQRRDTQVGAWRGPGFLEKRSSSLWSGSMNRQSKHAGSHGQASWLVMQGIHV